MSLHHGHAGDPNLRQLVFGDLTTGTRRILGWMWMPSSVREV